MSFPNGIANMNMSLLPDVWYADRDTSTLTIWKRNGEELYDMKKDPGERKNLAKDPKYSKVLAEHRAMLDDYIARTKDDYRSLKVDADPRCRNHTPGYPNHEGPGVREILKRK